MLSRTAPLRRELARALPSRPFKLRFWDETELEATEAESPTLYFKTPQALAHVLRAPGELVAFADQLRQHPGQWAVHPTEYGFPQSAANSASDIRKGRTAAFGAGFDAVSRLVDGKPTVYVRFVGESND